MAVKRIVIATGDTITDVVRIDEEISGPLESRIKSGGLRE